MSDVTFKCPSCGGYLIFDPQSQKWKCPYCASVFDESVLLEKDKEKNQTSLEMEETQAYGNSQVVYRCQSCGSEIVTDETTVATLCYYCHSPVVLQGKLKDDMRPELVLPFKYDKKAAVDQFMSWIKTKRFVPEAFFSRDQVETMSGVYYPHFISDVTVDAQLDGIGKNKETHDSGRFIDEYTHYFHVERSGVLSFRNIMRPALKSTNRKLSDGIHPFPLEDMKDFSGAYLSGFLAERRDMDVNDVRDGVCSEVQSSYVKPSLLQDVEYQSTDVKVNSDVTRFTSRYVLLPTWVLTYPNPADPKEPYYYVMNGCTGKICGKLPVARKKLLLHALKIGLGAFAFFLLISYFLL